EKRWITTWNHYLRIIKMFLRWLHNARSNAANRNTDESSPLDWKTPAFAIIKEKRTKRLSPYSETEIWERDELLSILKYANNRRDKAALALFWDLDARNHEVTMLKIKNIRLKDRYGEGEIPHEAKTGSGPALLTCSFPFVRDWLNEHPFRDSPEARVICNLYTGAPVKPEAMWTMMKSLRRRIVKMLANGEIADLHEQERLELLLKTKKWNPYCLRHSAITSDADFFPEYALKKKARWSMNSKQGARYIKRRMGNELKKEILARSGIVSEEEAMRQRPAVVNCYKCGYVNGFDTSYCSKCSYPLSQSAYEKIRSAEETVKIQELQTKHDQSLKELRNEIELKQKKLEALIQSLLDSGQLQASKESKSIAS